jgi:hypothetical protein
MSEANEVEEAEADEAPRRRCIGVTVRTPAGAGSAFGVEPQDVAASLVDRAVDWFVGRRQLERGGFRLGLLRGIEIIDLRPHDELAAAGVAEGDVLHLLTTEPQVDGAR